MLLLLRATTARDTLHFADSERSSLAADGIGPQSKVFKSDCRAGRDHHQGGRQRARSRPSAGGATRENRGGCGKRARGG